MAEIESVKQKTLPRDTVLDAGGVQQVIGGLGLVTNNKLIVNSHDGFSPAAHGPENRREPKSYKPLSSSEIPLAILRGFSLNEYPDSLGLEILALSSLEDHMYIDDEGVEHEDVRPPQEYPSIVSAITSVVQNWDSRAGASFGDNPIVYYRNVPDMVDREGNQIRLEIAIDSHVLEIRTMSRNGEQSSVKILKQKPLTSLSSGEILEIQNSTKLPLPTDTEGIRAYLSSIRTHVELLLSLVDPAKPLPVESNDSQPLREELTAQIAA